MNFISSELVPSATVLNQVKIGRVIGTSGETHMISAMFATMQPAPSAPNVN